MTQPADLIKREPIRKIKKILRARTNDSYSLKKTDYEIISQLEAKLYKEPHFMKKIFSFLFR